MLPHATLYKLGMKNECLYFNFLGKCSGNAKPWGRFSRGSLATSRLEGVYS